MAASLVAAVVAVAAAAAAAGLRILMKADERTFILLSHAIRKEILLFTTKQDIRNL